MLLIILLTTIPSPEYTGLISLTPSSSSQFGRFIFIVFQELPLNFDQLSAYRSVSLLGMDVVPVWSFPALVCTRVCLAIFVVTTFSRDQYPSAAHSEILVSTTSYRGVWTFAVLDNADVGALMSPAAGDL